jgi:predicted nuclease with TOPRIM domain
MILLVEGGKYMDNKELLQAISGMMDEKLEPINNRLENIEGRITSIEGRVSSIESDVKNIKSDISQMKKRMDSRFDYLEASIEKVDRRLAFNTDLLKETDKAIMEDVDKIKLRA